MAADWLISACGSKKANNMSTDIKSETVQEFVSRNSVSPEARLSPRNELPPGRALFNFDELSQLAHLAALSVSRNLNSAELSQQTHLATQSD